MIVLGVPLLILVILAAWTFHRGRLPQRNAAYVALVYLITVLGTLALTFHFWKTTGHSADRGWWPLLAVFSSAAWIGLILLLGTVARALILWRRKGASSGE